MVWTALGENSEMRKQREEKNSNHTRTKNCRAWAGGCVRGCFNPRPNSETRNSVSGGIGDSQKRGPWSQSQGQGAAVHRKLRESANLTEINDSETESHCKSPDDQNL